MHKRKLGKTDLEVSVLGLGAMTFGAQKEGGFFDRIQTDQDEANAIIERALAAGINFIDTANVYGLGASEEMVGKAIRGRRQELVVATKVGGRMGPGAHETGLSAAHVTQSCEASLRRLGTDYLDLFQIHWPDPATPLEETLDALDALVRAGKVRYLGTSNVGAYWITKALWLADRKRQAPISCLQTQYSLLARDIDDEIFPLCREERLGVIAWSPLAQGFLTGKYRGHDRAPSGTRMSGWAWVFDRHNTERQRAIVDEVQRWADQLSTTPARVAIAFVLAQPGMCSVLLGARNVQQLEDNLAAAELVLPPAALSSLGEISQPARRYPFGTLNLPK